MLRCMFCFFKQKTAYEMRISDWSSDGCSSDLQRVLAGLDEDGVHAAGDEAAALHRESGFQRIVGDMAEGGQPGARADRAEDEALAPVAGKELRRLARDLGGAAGVLLGAVGKAELADRDRRAAAGVGLHHVLDRSP